MNFNQRVYTKNYNKNNYKMYQFRIKKSDDVIINYLDSLDNKNSYIRNLINKDLHHAIYTIKEIKNIIIPILNKYEIYDIYLFGSYARGEANENSDVDIYCSKGKIGPLSDIDALEEELEEALKKKVDIIFTTTRINDFFRKHMEEDMIKLC